MKLKKQMLCFFIAFLTLFGQSMGVVQAAGGIVIDGNFQDWEGANAQYVDIQDNAIAKIATFQDDRYVYVAIQGTANGSTLSGEQMSFTQGTTEKKLAFQNTNGNLDISLRDSVTYAVIDNSLASGSLINGANYWEVQIPKSWSGEVTKLTFKNKVVDINTISNGDGGNTGDNGGNGEGDGGVEEVPNPGPSQNGIIIDGYYDDWKNLSHGEIAWDNSVSAEGCAVLDNDRICVHLESKNKNRDMNLDNFVIAIDDVEFPANAVKLRKVDASGNVDTNQANPNRVERMQLQAVIQGVDGKWVVLGDAYYTSQGKQKEDVEYCMDIALLEKALNVTISSGTKIELKFPSLGTGTIILQGTSSGPYIGIGLCILVVAGASYLKFRKHSKVKD